MKKNEIYTEAKARIQKLISEFGLNPNILKYFEEGKIYYSYITAMILGSIDNVTYDQRYVDAIKDFESKYDGFLVYHAIETNTPMGETLSLLYVSDDPDNWPGESLCQNYVSSYTINFTHPELSEFGDIAISKYGESGAIVRL